MPFRDGEIGRAELQKQRQRDTARRPAGLVSHSANVATPNYPILCPVSRLHSLTLQSVFVAAYRLSLKRAHHPRERATHTKARLNKFTVQDSNTVFELHLLFYHSISTRRCLVIPQTRGSKPINPLTYSEFVTSF